MEIKYNETSDYSEKRLKIYWEASNAGQETKFSALR